MKRPRFSKLPVFLRITGIQLLLLIAMAYPFLPGDYDRLALPVSNLVQVFGMLALPLSLIGLLCLLVPGRMKLFARLSLIGSVLVSLILALVALMSGGKVFACIVIAGLAALLIYAGSQLKKEHNLSGSNFSSLPYYLLVLPLVTFLFQVGLSKPLTKWSQDRSVGNAGELVAHIDSFYSRQGHYPPTLQAMWKDYYPDVVGIDTYHYLPHGDSYNISFEQVRFLFDVVGTREWMVYNPRDSHRVYSHTSWFLLLSPEELERSQGWYSAAASKHKHWKSFLFD